MRLLRLLGLVFVVVLALSAIAAAGAQAAERGFLLLSETKEAIADTGENAKDLTTVKDAVATVSCQKLSILQITWTEPGGKHFNLAKDIDFHWTECEEGGNKCETPGDVAGTLLLLMDMHLVNLLEEAGKLIPGFFWLVLNKALENRPILIECAGGLKIELHGAAPGIIEPLNAKNEITLTEEVNKYGIQAKAKVVCDKESETVCSEIKEKEPLQLNVGLGFETATMESELVTHVFNNKLDVLWDD